MGGPKIKLHIKEDIGMSSFLKWLRLNAANMITSIRYLSCAVIFVSWIFNAITWGSILFYSAIAIVSDAVDGWVARKLAIASIFGGYLDKVADKFLFIVLTIVLTADGLSKIDLPAIIITASLMIILLLQELALFLGGGLAFFKGWDFPASKWGKIKMIIECIFFYLWIIMQYIYEMWQIDSILNAIYLIDLLMLIAIFLAAKSIANYYASYLEKINF